MRNIKELLETMLEYQGLFSHGLCRWLTFMELNKIITISEHILLRKYIEKNPPWHYRFTISAYYWKKGKIRPRLRWIRKHIRKNSKL